MPWWPPRAPPGHDVHLVLRLVLLEGVLVAALAGAQRGLSLCQSLLRAQLGQRVNVMILEKALTLELRHFEDSEFYDKLTQARREASSRPLSLVMRTFGLVQNVISLVSFAALLVRFSPWTVVVLLLAGLPAFIAEAKFSGDAFRLFRWRSPETRMQMYLETVLAREDHAKEVQAVRPGRALPAALSRHLHAPLSARTARSRSAATSGDSCLGLLATVTLYGAYAWIALATVAGSITLGQMTMYLLLFRQGQSAVSAILSAVGGMYEDNLYLSTLYEYLDTPVPPPAGEARRGPHPEDGIRFEHVSFTYPGANEPALHDITCICRRAAVARAGRRERLGQDHADQAAHAAVRARLRDASCSTAWICASGTRGAARTHRRDLPGLRPLPDAGGRERRRGRRAAFRGRGPLARGRRARAGRRVHRALPPGYHTQLGKWFKDGRELSGGQWQKIALSRAFMRTAADVLVLDEPTAAMDARAEAEVFEHFRSLARGRITILISHRFSTVRMADQIAVLERGRIIERGSHESLTAAGGPYAQLFALQARGYQ